MISEIDIFLQTAASRHHFSEVRHKWTLPGGGLPLDRREANVRAHARSGRLKSIGRRTHDSFLKLSCLLIGHSLLAASPLGGPSPGIRHKFSGVVTLEAYWVDVFPELNKSQLPTGSFKFCIASLRKRVTLHKCGISHFD